MLRCLEVLWSDVGRENNETHCKTGPQLTRREVAEDKVEGILVFGFGEELPKRMGIGVSVLANALGLATLGLGL